jgi:hypothetical protein
MPVASREIWPFIASVKEDVAEEEALAFKPWEKQHAALCSPCSRAGCDGIAPCKITELQWSRFEEALNITEVCTEARRFEEEWLQGRTNATKLDLESAGELGQGAWVVIRENYWRKQTLTEIGTVVAEVITSDKVSGFIAQVRVTETPNEQLQGQTINRVRLPSLSEAQAECESLLTELLEGGPVVTMEVIYTRSKANSAGSFSDDGP